MNIRTPSDWHDTASGRDAGHDDMQMHIYRWIGRILPFVIRDEKRFEFQSAYAEHPTRVQGGSIVAFSDILATYRATEVRSRTKPGSDAADEWTVTKWRWIHIEIKPKVYSAGACIRQCYALLDAAKKSYQLDHSITHEVILAVWDDDPKAAILEEVSPFEVILISRSSAP